MFTSKGLFSEITCPYNEECVLPKCLFAHPKIPVANPVSSSQTASSLSAETSTSKKAAKDAPENGHDKRRKLSDGGAVPIHTVNKLEMINPSQKTEVLPGLKNTDSLSSGKRTVSSPSGRTSALASASTPNTAPRLVNATVASKPAPKTAASPLKPIKAESLNPRLLKHSPASHDLRTRLVKVLHDQLIRLNSELSKDVSSSESSLVFSAQQLITMALDVEEKAALDKPAIHSSVVKNTILRYKKMSVSDWKVERRTEHDALVAKSEATNGVKPAVEIPPVKSIETGLPSHLELAILPKLHTPLDSLSPHGYITAIPSAESIAIAKSGLSAAQGWEVCDRCKARFQVFPGRRESDGLLTSGGPCSYHWGKPFFPSRASTDLKGSKREKRYRCCGQAIGDSPGCIKAESHVFKVTEVKRLAALLNFIKTPDNEEACDDAPICIDGEMGYTVHGLELIRLTATSWPGGNPILDVLVRPIGEVLDLNSRWSGVLASQLTDAPALSVDPRTKNYDPAQLSGAEKLHVVESPEAARNLLLRFLSPKTPIIGHGLENDLNSVRLIHPTVIDTALLFPHQAGLPYRNALRTLVSIHLGRTIQAGGGLVAGASTSAVGEAEVTAGHDSKEDANAAGDLVRWAVGREWGRMKRVGWTLADGKLISPSRISEEFLEDKAVRIEAGMGKQAGVKRKRAEDEEEEGEVVEE